MARIGIGIGIGKGRQVSLLKPTYYVDAVNGLDTNDGLTSQTAWQTIAKVNATEFQSGDVIGFKKGCSWRETLIAPSSNIQFASYGGGDNPVIDGTELVTEWNLAELSPNVDFATGVQGWTGSMLSWQQAAIGGRTNVAKLLANSNDFKEINTLFGPHATSYKLAFDVYIPSTNATVGTVRIRTGVANYLFIGYITPVKDTWVHYELDFAGNPINNKLLLYITNSPTVTTCTIGDIVYMDNISLKPSDTYYDANVNIATPQLVYKDGLYQPKFASQHLIENNGWYYKTGILTYRSVGVPTGIAASARNYSLSTNGKSNVKIHPSINVKWGNYKRFQDNYLENILPSLGNYAEPSALVSPDGKRLNLWAHGYYAYSLDGISFSVPQPVNIGRTLHHHIMMVGSTYYYYGGTSDTKTLYTSADGITFTSLGIVLSKGTAGQWDDSGLGNLFVWKEGANWYMLYEASKLDGTGFKLGLATSNDGINWTKYANNPVISFFMAGNPELPRVNNEVIKHNGKYYMYFHSQTSVKTQYDGIYRAYSTDLINWTNEGKILDNRTIHNTLITFGDHAICEFKGKSYMFWTPSNQSTQYHIDCAIDNRPLAEMLTLTV